MPHKNGRRRGGSARTGLVTIKDVARTAGVSVATVSRVSNDSHRVREGTRTRVQEVARRLGYTPHAAARSLSTRRTHTIGVLLPDLYGEFFSEIIRGIDQTARAQGYHLLLASARNDGDAFQAALHAMRGRVDALIVMAPELDGDVRQWLLPERLPVMLLNGAPSDAPFGSLAIANYDGVLAMVRHLAGLGHRRIAIIRGAAGNFDAAERLRGYRAALSEARLAADPSLEFPGDFSEAAGHAAAQRILALAHRPTAVFAANDCMAIGAMSAFRDAGLRVPEDIALGGFDDIPMARYVDPALTSVHVDICALGERAAAGLLAALREPADRHPRRETLPTTLVVRRSCGAQRG